MTGVNGPCGERGDQEFPETPIRLLLSLWCLTWLPTQKANRRQIRAIFCSKKCTSIGSHADNCFGLQREITGIAEKYHMSLGSVCNEGNFILIAWAWSQVRGVISSVGVTN